MSAIGDVDDVLGYPVYVQGLEKCVTSIMSHIQTGASCRWLACINPHSYVNAKSNRDASQALLDADWLIPDGAGMVLGSKIMGGNIKRRVTGSDIFFEVLQRLNEEGGRSVFFLGATDETLSLIRNRMARDYPCVTIAGVHSPPFKGTFSEEDDQVMLQHINRSSADVLWVGMTSPKQDIWLRNNRHRLNVRFAAAVGAVFDFYSMRVKRSPVVFQRLGLEWLPRLLQEPKRLWRRTFVSAPLFLWYVAWSAICKKAGRWAGSASRR